MICVCVDFFVCTSSRVIANCFFCAEIRAKRRNAAVTSKHQTNHQAVGHKAVDDESGAVEQGRDLTGSLNRRHAVSMLFPLNPHFRQHGLRRFLQLGLDTPLPTRFRFGVKVLKGARPRVGYSAQHVFVGCGTGKEKDRV